MRLFSLGVGVVVSANQHRMIPRLIGDIAQCGANMPNFIDICGDQISPPTCAEDEACFTMDRCYYTCIKKIQCQTSLYNALLDDGKLLCNCELEPSYPYSWTCDFVNDEHGNAFMPPINKVYDWDDRKLTLLEGTRHDEYHAIQADELKYFNNFFQTSPCEGLLVDDSGSKSVRFNNIFNNPDCMPSCKVIDQDSSTFSEQCEIVIGYDDLMMPVNDGSETAALARGTSWQLTCSRQLQYTITDKGSVIDDAPAPIASSLNFETKFNMLISCCDPEDPNCTDDCTRTPVIQIGPYADPKRFFVRLDYEYGNKEIRDRGYLHIESCTVEEVTLDGNKLNGPLEVVQAGCPTKFGIVTIMDTMKERTVDQSYRESMELLPFKINRAADMFILTCDLINCPWYGYKHKLCQLKDQCQLNDRYEALKTYAKNNFSGNNSLSRRRTGSASVPEADLVTKTLRHPCTEIKQRGDKYCVTGDETCWTYELCRKRRNGELYFSTESSSAFAMIIPTFYLTLIF